MQNDLNNPETRYTSPPPVMQDRRNLPYKVTWLAGFLSGFFPGIGQIYVGYYRDGITFGLVFAGVITALSSGGASGLEPLFGLSLGFIWLYGIIDAARRAQAVNRALDGYGNQPVPDDLPLPGSGGSFTGGVVLILLGLLLLGDLKFGLSLEWLADWWPLGLVGLGGWLVWKARTEKAADGQ